MLKLILPQNQQHFSKWIIVTSEDDKETQQVVQELGDPSIVSVMFFDFGKSFNKGGAIRMAQKSIPETYCGPVLLLDSDIYLPDTLRLPTLKPDTLYGPLSRRDFHTYESFRLDKANSFYRNNFYGFFQLYLRQGDKYLYTDSSDASVCDCEFRDNFKTRVLTSVKCKHLGIKGIHWKGRKGPLDYKPKTSCEDKKK